MKLSKDLLESFNQNIISILSPQRLQSYNEDIDKHYQNLFLALEAGKRIANLEIYLRNKMDFVLQYMEGKNWIRAPQSLALITQKGHTPLSDLNSSQILSGLMLGEIVGLINFYKIEHYMLDLQDLDFRKYHWSNRNFFYINGKKHHLSNIAKVKISLNLIRNIRNRAFHWENLLKVTTKENGNIFPRITHKENGTTIGIMPEKILEFLDDLIEKIGNEAMKKYAR